MKKILFSILLGLLLVYGINMPQGVVHAADPDVTVSLVLLDSSQNQANAFLLNESIQVLLSLRNNGPDLFTTKGFLDSDFHLTLHLVGPDGVVPPTGQTSSTEPQTIEMEQVEVLKGYTRWELEKFNALDYYAIIAAGDWWAKSRVQARFYPPEAVVSIGGVDYAPISSANSAGLIESATVNFSIVADYSADGKPQAITFEYTGDGCDATQTFQDPSTWSCSGDPNDASPVRIVAASKARLSHKKTKIWFDGTVFLNAEFTVDALDIGETQLGPNTHIFIYDSSGQMLQELQIHTSASEPITSADQYGALKVKGYRAIQ